MAQHDYIIDNQTASAFRTDLNNALAASASLNSGTAAPTTTYANMLWFETDTDTLWKRNEANSAWIALGIVNEATSKFDPIMTFASSSDAATGTEDTKPITVAKAGQVVSQQLANLSTTAGVSVTASGLVLTSYRTLHFLFNSVSGTTAGAYLTLDGVQVTPTLTAATGFIRGVGILDLGNGCCNISTSYTTGAAPKMAVSSEYAGQLTYTTATTSITLGISAGTFDNGTFRIIGYR